MSQIPGQTAKSGCELATSPRTNLAALDAAIIECRACPRLVAWREHVGEVKRASFADEQYWAKPVPGFGSAEPLIWIVGLAPAAHGGNRTGRMFTGDRSGDWLYGSLYRVGLASQPTSVARDDGLLLDHVRITAAVHCAPPDNKPTTEERRTCASWLEQEAALIAPTARSIVVLGGFAWTAALGTLRRVGWTVERGSFGHGVRLNATTPAGDPVVVLGSYHPSQQNTFTGRLTEPMLDTVLAAARDAART